MCLRLVVPSLLTEPKLLPLFYNVISFKLDVPASNYVFHYFHYQFERAFLLFLILLPFSRMSVRSKLSDPDSEPKNYITHSSHMYTISQKINCTEIVKKKKESDAVLSLGNVHGIRRCTHSLSLMSDGTWWRVSGVTGNRWTFQILSIFWHKIMGKSVLKLIPVS
jgi:hypothetical protein